VLKDAGKTVPGEVAIVGFNDITSARHTEPPTRLIQRASA
jgi:DNA-binding LacI/PurR family transcriptional regulator